MDIYNMALHDQKQRPSSTLTAFYVLPSSISWITLFEGDVVRGRWRTGHCKMYRRTDASKMELVYKKHHEEWLTS
jgi:hypothetical protein